MTPRRPVKQEEHLWLVPASKISTYLRSQTLLCPNKWLLNLPTTVYWKFIICTDSQLCVQRLTNLKKTYAPLQATYYLPFGTSSNWTYKFQFTWTFAHSRTPGNEIVDAAAKALSTTRLDIYIAEDIKQCISTFRYWNKIILVEKICHYSWMSKMKKPK